jgi:hypothetical protein
MLNSWECFLSRRADMSWLREAGYEGMERFDLLPTPPISLMTARRPAVEEEP